VLSVVGEVLAGAGVGKDRQAIAMERDPLREVAELIARYRQLAAAARVWADRPGVKMADGHPKFRLRRRREGLRTRQLIGVEIDVRVEVADAGLGHCGNLVILLQKSASLLNAG
jgi:hypothetical protein